MAVNAAFNAERGPNQSIYYSSSHFAQASLYTIRESARIMSATFFPFSDFTAVSRTAPLVYGAAA
jgi:hypothetical protein